MDVLKEEATKLILKTIENAKEPLETKEIEEALKTKGKGFTRTIILYRLNFLRAEGLVKGKQVGAGKGTWIWWGK